MKTTTALFVLIFTLGIATAQNETPAHAGMWFGKGETWEETGEVGVRLIYRRSDSEFWFRVQPSGKVVGQAYVSYSGELIAMEWEVPVPGSGSINAGVSGGSEKTTFQVDLEGQVTPEGQLTLKPVGETGDMTVDGMEFNFEIRASVSAPVPLGSSGVSVDTGLSPEFTVIDIPAKAWSPFQGLTADVKKHPAGAMTVDVTNEGDKFRIHWHATQVVPARIEQLQEKVEALEKALAALKGDA